MVFGKDALKVIVYVGAICVCGSGLRYRVDGAEEATSYTFRWAE